MTDEAKEKAQRRDRQRRLAQARNNAKKAVSDALKEFAAGDKEALPKALYFYFCTDPRGPKPLAKIWCQAYAAAVFRGQYNSWDEVFGELLKKGGPHTRAQARPPQSKTGLVVHAGALRERNCGRSSQSCGRQIWDLAGKSKNLLRREPAILRAAAAG